MNTFKELTPARQQLVRLMQKVNYGEIRQLSVKSGEPVMDPPPTIVRAVKFGGDNGARGEAAISDFELKSQVKQLLAELDALPSGEFERIEVKGGLPFMAVIKG